MFSIRNYRCLKMIKIELGSIFFHCQEGVTTTTSYGLAIAKTVRFPSDIMKEAFELSAEFMSGISAQNTVRNICSLSNTGNYILCISRRRFGLYLEWTKADTLECGPRDFAYESEYARRRYQ